MTLHQDEVFQYKPFVADFPYRSIVKRDLVQLRNNPHPTYVRHVKGFLGQPTQLVETDKDEVILSQGTVEGYIKDSMKKGIWNYKNDSKKFVKKSKDLDEILSLQYFTGLQNFSFKENYLPYLGYREYLNNWRKILRNLTINAYQPTIGQSRTKNELQSTSLQHPNEWINKNSDNNRCKSMYSASGRLSTCQDLERKTSSRQRIRSQQRLSTGLAIKSNEIDETPDFNNLDASVFVLIANLLQTTSVHMVQNWLSQSTEREKALMTSMIQAVLSNQNSNQSLYCDGPTEKGTQTSKYLTTPGPFVDDNKIHSTEKSNFEDEQSDILVVENTMINNAIVEKPNELRPPTSSTFRPNKNSRSDSNATKFSSKASMWHQKESLNSAH